MINECIVAKQLLVMYFLQFESIWAIFTFLPPWQMKMSKFSKTKQNNKTSKEYRFTLLSQNL